MSKKWKKRFKIGVFSTSGESPPSEKVTNIFHWMLLLSEKCKIWRLEWSRLVVWLQTAFGDNPSEICARKTRGISVSHICAKIQPLLSSAWEECDQWTFFIPTNGLIMQRNLFLSYFSRFYFLPIRLFMKYIRKWFLKKENAGFCTVQCINIITVAHRQLSRNLTKLDATANFQFTLNLLLPLRYY